MVLTIGIIYECRNTNLYTIRYSDSSTLCGAALETHRQNIIILKLLRYGKYGNLTVDKIKQNECQLRRTLEFKSKSVRYVVR